MVTVTRVIGSKQKCCNDSIYLFKFGQINYCKTIFVHFNHMYSKDNNI